MKVLYAIQGTGNGHYSRAKEAVPRLKQLADVDVVTSGPPSTVPLPFAVDIAFEGLSFAYGRGGRVNYLGSLPKLNILRFAKDVLTAPVQEYDLVMTDFEPVTAWACQLKGVYSVAFGNHASYLSPKTPRPKQPSFVGEWILRYFAPTSEKVGFHYQRYDDFIHPPLIREEVRRLQISDAGHVTVYLPGYEDEELIDALRMVPRSRFQIFSRSARQPFEIENIFVSPIDSSRFLESLAACRAVIMGAGFQGTAEALFLGKKLAVIPMGRHFEQEGNAAALEQLGVLILQGISPQHLSVLPDWIETAAAVRLDCPDNLDVILKDILYRREHLHGAKKMLQSKEFRT